MWRWHGFRTRRDEGSARLGDELLDEIELFLNGHYATMLAARGETVPAWAWVDAVAQAPQELLAIWASAHLEGVCARRRPSGWEQAVFAVAREVLETANRLNWDVTKVQRRALKGLNLRYQSSEVSASADPDCFVHEVAAELAACTEQSDSNGETFSTGG